MSSGRQPQAMCWTTPPPKLRFCSGGGVELVPAPAELPARFPATLADRLHRERVGQEGAAGGRVGGVGVDAVEPLQRVLAGHVGRVPRQRLVGRFHDPQPVREPLVVGEVELVLGAGRVDSLPGQPPLPEVERGLLADAPHDRVHVARARAPVGAPAVLEEADVVAVGGLLVPVEDVVGRPVGLVDRLLHDPQAQHPHVEVGVAGGVGGDSGDVMDALEFHDPVLRSSVMVP